MSLIAEALRKRQEEERRGRAAGPVSYRSRRRRGLGPAAVALLAIAAAAGGAGLYHLLGRDAQPALPEVAAGERPQTPATSVERRAESGTDHGPEPAEPPVEAATVSTPRPGGRQPAPAATPASDIVAPVGLTAREKAPAPSSAATPNPAAAVETETPPARARRRRTAADRGTTTAPAAPTGDELAPEPVDPPVNLRRAIRSITSTGGTVFELGGIAFSAGGPVALVNGRAMAPGETIAGYELLRITPESIVLRGGDETLRLELGP